MNNSGTPDLPAYVVDLIERVTELERRVLVLGDEPPADGGCCTVLCCNDNPGTTLTAGSSATFCAVTLEDTAGSALRLVVIGTVDVVLSDVAGGAWSFQGSAAIGGVSYLEYERFARTVGAQGDEITVPIVNVIDVNVPGPVVSLKVQNLGAPSITVARTNIAVMVYGVRDGSSACGEIDPYG